MKSSAVLFRTATFAAFLLVLKPFAAYAQAPAAQTAHATARKPPAWTDTAVIYEVYVRDFSDEGKFSGVTARLEKLRQLGVNTLWLMPIHPIGEVKRLGTLGSPYSPRDFYAIDPALGTRDDLKALVAAAHAHGMRVLLDMVADHTSWDSPMMSHPDFYTHDSAGKIVSPQGWSDVAGLNYDNPALREYMIDMFVYWLKTFQLDGFRCDAATYVPTAFWDELRPAVEAVKPDVLMLAEASKPDLMTKAFDLDYAWPLLAQFNAVLQDGSPASSLQTLWADQQRLFPQGAVHMLTSDDHDERRGIVRYGERATLSASALVFTLPGVPMLYNGMEVGDATPSGAPQLFSKLSIDWSAAAQERAFPDFYKALIDLRQSSPALRHGDLIWLHNSDEQHVVSFLRRSAEESDLVTVNLSNTPFHGSVEVGTPAGGHWTEAALPQREGSRRRQQTAQAEPLANALPALSLAAFQVRIFRLTQTRQ